MSWGWTSVRITLAGMVVKLGHIAGTRNKLPFILSCSIISIMAVFRKSDSVIFADLKHDPLTVANFGKAAKERVWT